MRTIAPLFLASILGACTFFLEGCAFINEATAYHPNDGGSEVVDPKPETDPGMLMLERINRKSAELNDGIARGCVMKVTGEIGDCGSIYDVWSASRTVQDFIRDKCNRRNDKACSGKISDAYAAQIQLRYPLADFNKVDLECKASGGCNMKQWEIRVMGSNNWAAYSRWHDRQVGNWKEDGRMQRELDDRVDAERRATRSIHCRPDGIGGMVCD